jgi:uncharacterized membrane protein YcaP (DUF421 family)
MLLWDSLLRVCVAFFSLILWSRIIGKKLISHMTFFDFIAGVTFGAIGGNMIFNKLVPLWIGIINLSVFSILVLLSDYISLKSYRGRHLLEGAPRLIIDRGQIQLDALKGNRLTIDELLMLLRKKDVFYVDEVEWAYFETNGTLSILKKSPHMPLSRQDADVDKKSRGLPQSCIIDGKVIHEGLMQVGKDRQWMEKYLEDRDISVEHVLLAQIDQLGNVYIDSRS